MRAVNRGAVEREPEVVDHGVAQHHRVADRDRLREVVAPAERGREDVGRLAERRREEVRRRHVAAEDRVVLVHLEIDLADGLRFADVPRVGDADAAAWIGGGRQVARNAHGRRAEERRIDPVVHERRAERDVAARVARRRGDLREVAGEHRRRRDEPHVVGRSLVDLRALVGAEEEEAIGDDRAAKRAAELVALQAVVAPLAGGRIDGAERVRGVELVVAEELEQVGVKEVRARLGRDVDRRAGVEAVLRVLRAGLDAELLQRVGERQRQVEVVVGVVVQRAVEHVGDAERLAAGHRDATPPCMLRLDDGPGVHRGAGETGSGRRVAAVERQLLDPLVLDDMRRWTGCVFRRAAQTLRPTPSRSAARATASR